MLAPKKSDHALARRQLYLNYGALSLATTLKLKGYETTLIHGEYRHPREVFEWLQLSEQIPSRFPLLLSIPSYYALPWAQVFCQLIKQKHPTTTIVVGGRWVVDPDPQWFRTLLPEADFIAPGLGESYIERLLTEMPHLDRAATLIPDFVLDHQIVVDFLKYQPSVEVSRGCGMGCQFCEERDIPIQKMSHPTRIVNSLEQILMQYGGGEIHPYLQSSMFVPTARWAALLANEAKRLDRKVKWRTETRVDAMSPETLACLAEAGLGAIDLGLETASPKQILAMKKSNNPDRYLRKAEKLLAACHTHGVKTKVNLLLYPGETCVTLSETKAWLDENCGNITGVSAGPVIAYGPPKTASILISDWEKHGARPVDPRSAEMTGISKMHLSNDFDSVGAESACSDLSRRYMDTEAYFALKSFSYFPRNYSREDFTTDILKSEEKSLPFSTQPPDRAQ